MDGLSLFATPMFSFDDAGDVELDRELVRRLGYQDLMHRVVARVRATFFELARGEEKVVDLRYRLGVQAWAMVMRHGDHTLVHDHAEAHFSVAYYPDAGDADLTMYPDSGKLTFVDPRRGGTVIPGVELFPSQFAIVPQPGLLVVFPGWLQHFVQPYRGGRPRVCISCNVRFEPDPRG